MGRALSRWLRPESSAIGCNFLLVLALLRETGILCVHGSGFGMLPEDGFLRIVFLADPRELAVIYSDMPAFTGDYLRRN